MRGMGQKQQNDALSPCVVPEASKPQKHTLVLLVVVVCGAKRLTVSGGMVAAERARLTKSTRLA
jgi:hypothetical protein